MLTFFQFFSLILSLSLALASMLAGLEGIPNDLWLESLNHLSLERRQDASACATVCMWLGKITGCTTGDALENDACDCQVILDAGDLVDSCQQCIRPFNATLADDLVIAQEDCEAPGSPTLTCSGPCSALRQAFETCVSGDDQCVCPLVVADGPICSQCFASSPADASGFNSAISYCISKGLTGTVPPITPPPTSQSTGLTQTTPLLTSQSTGVTQTGITTTSNSLVTLRTSISGGQRGRVYEGVWGKSLFCFIIVLTSVLSGFLCIMK